MNTLYTYYKAFKELFKIINKNKYCSNNLQAIKQLDFDKDVFYETSYEINIDNDWIEAIESKLDFIAKCIKEERQFILRNGEVVPIEKVRSVSKESVSHLARHSNLIKREPVDDIIPDELYTVEKLNDYAVYENRFLYYVLSYLKDFVDLRYNEIVKFSNMYQSYFSMEKDINISNRHLKYEVKIDESIENDKIKQELNLNKDKIDRIESIYRAILSYLNTPLMIEVSKAPMIKLPIIVTNVLKMNQNFKAVLELYNFIVGYDKKGYEIIDHKKSLTPLDADESKTYAMIIDLYSNLNYMYSNDLVKDLNNKYNKEVEENREETKNKNIRDIKLIKKKLENKEITAEEYILEVERENKLLENKIHSLNEKVDDFNNLLVKIDSLKENINYINDKLSLKDEEILKNNEENEKHIQEINDINDKKIEDITKENNIEIENLKDKINLLENDISNLNKLNEEKEEGRQLLLAKLNAYRYKNKDLSLHNEFTNEEEYEQLQNQANLLNKLVKEQWKYTKKHIYNEVKEEYSYKNDKKERKLAKMNKKIKKNKKVTKDDSKQ